MVGHGSGSIVAYTLAHRDLQKNTAKQTTIHGLLLLSPNLLETAPEPGKEQQYVPLASQTSVPVFIFQPSYSPHHWHLDKLISEIKTSGTKLHYQRLDNVRDGYALRDNRSEKEQELREQMASMFQAAIKKLTNDD